MSDVTKRVSLEFDTNAAAVARDVKTLSDSVDEAGRTGSLSSNQMQSLTRNISSMEKTLGLSTHSVRKYSDSFAQLRKEASAAEKALQAAAQIRVVKGKTDPLNYSANRMSLSDAQKNLAVSSASSLSLEAVSQKRLDLENRLSAAKERGAKADQDLVDLGRTQLEQARNRLDLAQKELSAAQALQGRVSSGKGAGAVPFTVSEQVAAEERLAKAKQENVAAQRALNSAESAEKAKNARLSAEQLRLEQQLNAVRSRGVEADRVLASLGKTQLEQARERLAVTQKELSLAQSGASKIRPARGGAISSEQLAAEERLTKAKLDNVAAQRAFNSAVEGSATSLPTLRYALYDVSNSLAIVGAGLVTFSTLSIKAAVDYERAFANVIRTNDSLRTSPEAASAAFKDFTDLAGKLPITFEKLAEIGTLAGQLDVAAGSLEGFTESVAMFSATTGVAIDETATAFGRLDKLLPGVEGNFDALGSSILNVGLNSVATEDEIIKITTQLTGVANQAGLTYDQLIGLSGALASVGVQPELARGTDTRLFGQISRAVAVGGESLQDFAAISGTTAEDFASSWNSNAMGTVVGLLEGLKARGGEAESALRAVGITSSRDVPAILKLANTVDTVLSPALKNAADGANEASQLSENYAVISATLASKLQRLANNFQSLMAAMGGATGPLSAFVESLNSGLTKLIDFAQTPWGGGILQFGVILAGLVGAVTLLGAVLIRGAASMLAFRTAVEGVGITATTTSGKIAQLTAAILGFEATSARGVAISNRLTTAIKGMSIAGAALIAVALAGWVRNWTAEMSGAVVDVDTLGKAFSRLGEKAAGADADFKATLSKSLESLGKSTSTPTTASLVLRVVTAGGSEGFGIPASITKALDEGNAALDVGLARLGEKATNWFTTDIFTGEPTWLAGVLDSSFAELDKLESAFIQAWDTASTETQKQAVLDSFEELEQKVLNAGGTLEGFKYNFSEFYEAIGSGINQTKLAAETQDAFNEELRATQDELLAIVDDVYSSVNGYLEVQRALFDLGEEFITSGAKAAFSGDAMQSAIKSIISSSGSAPTAAANLKVFYDYLLNSTDASVQSLDLLRKTIAGVLGAAGGKIATPTIKLPNFQAFTQGVSSGMASVSKASKKAGKDVDKVTEKLRTLVDYASDLSSVWNRAFDIRFSGQNTLDAVQNTLQDFRDAAAESAKRVLDLRNALNSLSADMQSLQADISALEYFLRIAQEYGDTQRATAIEAELAKKRAELAEKSADLAEKNQELQREQESQNKTLVGNTQAARDNRKAIQDLVKQYEDQVNKLASSGLSQGELIAKTAQLRQEFLDQAAALGFNRDELELYARSFTDLSSILSATPVRVTVDTTGLGPAEIAIREFAARANQELNNIGSLDSLSGPGGFASGFEPIIEEAEPGLVSATTDIAHKAKMAFMNALPAPLKRELGSSVYDALVAGTMTVQEGASALGYSSAEAFLRDTGTALNNGVKLPFATALQVSTATVRQGGEQLGSTAGESTNSSMKTSLDFQSPIIAATPGGVSTSSAVGLLMGSTTGRKTTEGMGPEVNFASQISQATPAGVSAGSAAGFDIGGALADSLRRGVSQSLDFILGRDTKARKIFRELTGFQEGGYTGTGPAGKVAGVVHAGEYVLTKDQVNQRTGLPYASALGQFMEGAPSRSVAPSASPTTTGTPMVALTAGTIQAIAQATGKVITLDGKIVAESSANHYAQQSSVGAY